MPTPTIIYYGQAEPLAAPTPLRAGPLSALYDQGDLRYIRFGEHEIIRRLYCAVRDKNWGTVPATLHDVQIEQGDDAFSVSYRAEHVDADFGIHFVWHARITGDAAGTLRFEMDGQAHSTCERNRIGFCVLHPTELAGVAVRVTHDDGSVEDGVFPQLIAPHQPFFGIRALQHAVGDAASAEIRFEGEVFEMEDQRNWTDASYKTYCTPLDRPFPVTVNTGDAIQQAVTLNVSGTVPDQSAADAAITIDVAAGATVPLPRLGLGVAYHGGSLSETDVRRLRALHLDHLRVDVRLQTDVERPLRSAAAQAAALNCGLFVAVHLSNAAAGELDRLAEQLRALAPPLVAFLIFHIDEKSTAAQWVDMAAEKLGAFAVPIGAGTDAFFTELNRGRPAEDARDFSTFSTNPQVHAFDVLDLTETLACHAPLIATAESFNHGKPLTVSPVTLKMRFNPNATGSDPVVPAGTLPPQADVRQMSLFGAGWTLGSLKYLSAASVARITYYETTGLRGLMTSAHDAVDNALFPAAAGTVYPLYHVFADVAEFVGGDVVQVHTSAPLAVDGLLLRDAGRARLLLANYTEQPQTVQLAGFTGSATLKVLDAQSYEQAVHDPEGYRAAAGDPFNGDTVTIAPFAIVRIDQA